MTPDFPNCLRAKSGFYLGRCDWAFEAHTSTSGGVFKKRFYNPSVRNPTCVRESGQQPQRLHPLCQLFLQPPHPQPGLPRMRHQLARRAEDLKPQPLGRAVSHFSGSANRFSAVSTLCVITAIRSHAALAPSRPHGITPEARSFFSTSCSASIVPAFSRCHPQARRIPVPSVAAHHEVFTSLPSAKTPCRLRMRMAM